VGKVDIPMLKIPIATITTAIIAIPEVLFMGILIDLILHPFFR
jgi:hypothetical protein